MATDSVVLRFDGPEKSVLQGVGARQQPNADAPSLRVFEKALHHRIVVAITAAAHSGNQSVTTVEIAMACYSQVQGSLASMRVLVAQPMALGGH